MEAQKAIIRGRIQKIGEIQTFESGFYKREIIVNTGGEYPQQIKVSFLKDKADILEAFTVEQSVELNIDIRGREYNGNFYNDLVGWKIVKLEQQTAEPQRAQQMNATAGVQFNEPTATPEISTATKTGDLPF